jgi:glycosyltransferase involved in cell wall biosynthesis
MNIVSVSTSDAAGGAEKVARDLFQAYRAKGHTSRLAVGTKRLDDQDVFEIPRRPQPVPATSKVLLRLRRPLMAYEGRIRGAKRLRLALDNLISDVPAIEDNLGRERMSFPGTRDVLDQSPGQPDILHGHNLHGDFFDLRQLPELSRRVRVFLTLHDAWLLSGHCAHSFACERWRTGCGACPDLNIPPAIRVDGTAYNWSRKQKIYRHSRLYVATPCRWLMDKVEQSILAEGIVEARVIPYGVNLDIFRPGNKLAIREQMGLPADACVIFFASNYIQSSYWKDFPTMMRTVEILADRVHDQKVIFIALGEAAPDTRMGTAEVRFVPFQQDPGVVARYYQAADIYLHAAHADTFPNTVLEALACGVPVVATRVGGIPEQVEEGVTGYLVPERDPAAMASRVEQLIRDLERRRLFSQQARQTAQKRFNFDRHVQDYLQWFADVGRI